MSDNKTKPICTACKSDDVRADSYSSWDPETEKWETEEAYEKFFCRQCEGDTSVDWVPVKQHAILTLEEQADYVREGYGQCPYCKSDQIEGGSWENEGNIVWQRVSCFDCGRSWQDIYELSNIDQMNEEGIPVAGALTAVDLLLMQVFDPIIVLMQIRDHCQKQADKPGIVPEADVYAHLARGLSLVLEGAR